MMRKCSSKNAQFFIGVAITFAIFIVLAFLLYNNLFNVSNNINKDNVASSKTFSVYNTYNTISSIDDNYLQFKGKSGSSNSNSKSGSTGSASSSGGSSGGNHGSNAGGNSGGNSNSGSSSSSSGKSSHASSHSSSSGSSHGSSGSHSRSSNAGSSSSQAGHGSSHSSSGQGSSSASHEKGQDKGKENKEKGESKGDEKGQAKEKQKLKHNTTITIDTNLTTNLTNLTNQTINITNQTLNTTIINATNYTNFTTNLSIIILIHSKQIKLDVTPQDIVVIDPVNQTAACMKKSEQANKYATHSTKDLSKTKIKINADELIRHNITKLHVQVLPPVDGLATEIIAVQPNSKATINADATITLRKYAEVNSIVFCSDWSATQQRCLTAWQPANISFVQNGTHISFTVTHFTAYAGNATGSFNATNLTIYDSNDTEGGGHTVYTSQQVWFYANYTDNQSNAITPADGGQCNITFNISNTFETATMQYDNALALYIYNKTFTNASSIIWNVTCSAPNYNTVSATDNITINQLQCGVTLTLNTTLDADYSSNGTCFTIGNDAITLDCNGHSIIGNGSGYSVFVDNHSNITIKNCYINGFAYGIMFNNTNQSLIDNNTIFNNSDTGIRFDNNNNYNNITNNIIRDNVNDGIEIDGSHNNRVINNSIYSNNINVGVATNDVNSNFLYFYNNDIYDATRCMAICKSNGVRIISNKVNCTQYGIVTTCENITIYKNNITGTFPIFLEGGNNHNVSYNYIYNYSKYGIELLNNQNVTVEHNTIINNLNNYNAILISATDSIIRSNYLDNVGYGAHIYDGSTNVSLYNNTIKNIRVNGITIQTLVYNTSIYNNTIYNCTNGYCVYFDMASDIENVNVYDNNITLGNYGLYIQRSRGFANFSYNNIAHVDYAIYGNNFSNFLIFHNYINNATTTGISFGYSAYGPTYNNTVSFNYINDSMICLVLYGNYSGNDTIYNNIFNSNMLENCDYGIYLFDDVVNNTFTNNTIKFSNYAVYVSDYDEIYNVLGNVCDNNYFYDNNITNNILLNSSSTQKTYFIGNKYNRSNVKIYGSAVGWFGWWVDVYVNSSNNQPVANANVTAYDKDNTLRYTGLTDTTGWANFTLWQYWQNATTTYDFNNYTISAEKNPSATTTANITGNTILTLTLSDVTSLTSCTTISSPGYYDLINDITVNGTCFVIDSDNVTLNCNNHKIIGNGSGYSVYVDSNTNITIKNCYVEKFETAVYGNKVDNSIFFNNTIYNCSWYAFDLWNSTNLNVSYNLINYSGYYPAPKLSSYQYRTSALSFRNVSYSIIDNNEFYDNGNGSQRGGALTLNNESNHNIISNNYITGRYQHGDNIWIRFSHYNRIINNTVFNVNYNAIWIREGNHTFIYGNNITLVERRCVGLRENMTNITIKNNHFQNCGWGGIVSSDCFQREVDLNSNIFKDHSPSNYSLIHFGGGGENITIYNNTFNNFSSQLCIYVAGNLTNLSVLYNNVSNGNNDFLKFDDVRIGNNSIINISFNNIENISDSMILYKVYSTSQPSSSWATTQKSIYFTHNTIKNVTVAFYIRDHRYVAYIESNTIEGCSDSTDGCLYFCNSSNIVIKNNYISPTSSTVPSIYMYFNLTNATIENNTIINGTWGIGAEGYAVNITIKNNIISRQVDDCIWFWGSYYNVTIENNTLNDCDLDNSNWGDCFNFAANITNMTVNNNKLANCGKHGIYLGSCDWVNPSKCYGNPKNIWFKNMNMTNVGTNYDVWINTTGSTEHYFLNVSYNRSKEKVDGQARLWRGWWVNAKVDIEGDGALSGAEVKGVNADGQVSYLDYTNASGMTQRKAVWEYWQNASTNHSFNPQTFTASKAGYVSNSKVVNITDNTMLQFYLMLSSGGGAECTDECSPGDAICIDETTLQQCVLGEEGCYVWQTVQCDAGYVCVNGECVINATNVTNTPPEITSYSPTESVLNISEEQQFSITAVDADNDAITVYWIVDGDTVKTIEGVAKVYSSFTFSADVGWHDVMAKACDNYGCDSVIWRVYVNQQLCIDEWECTEWSNCSGMYRYRECHKLNPECSSNTNKPAEKMYDPTCNPEIAKQIELEGCTPKWECGSWSDCMLEYSTESIVLGNVEGFVKGMQQRYCVDVNNCTEARLIEKRECSLVQPLTRKEVEKCFITYVQLYDANGNLVAEYPKDRQYLHISLMKEGYCWYCYDGKQDYDETGIDCGGSCKPCKPELIKQRKWLHWLFYALAFILALLAVLQARTKRINKQLSFVEMLKAAVGEA